MSSDNFSGGIETSENVCLTPATVHVSEEDSGRYDVINVARNLIKNTATICDDVKKLKYLPTRIFLYIRVTLIL